MLPEMAESGYHWLQHKQNRNFILARYLRGVDWFYVDRNGMVPLFDYDYWAPCVPPDRPVMPANLTQYMFWLGEEGEAENAV